MTTEIIQLDHAKLEGNRDEIVRVHHAAYALPPHRETEEDAARLGRELLELARFPGFRCVVARDRRTEDVVGLALGWTSERGQGWRDTIGPPWGPRSLTCG